MDDRLLEVKDLHVSFRNKKGSIPVLRGVNFTLEKGKVLCIVGESGSGKSLTSLAIMGLLPEAAEVPAGEINFNGENLVDKSMREMSKIRGNDISMIFQEPMTSLNPVHTIGKQISEPLRVHQKLGKKETKRRVIELLELVGLPSPEIRINEYPHQLSGGMRQRVMIAIALACNPKILVADEPTTALDVTIQAQILKLINKLKDEMDMSIILITHDLGVVSEMADEVIVMYAGKIVEISDTKTLFDNPSHPYTKGLIESIPKLEEDQDKLPIIKGSVPDYSNMPKGCNFSTRCPFAKPICSQSEPELIKTGDSQTRCWMYTEQWDN